MDNGLFNSFNTYVGDNVKLLVAVPQHRGISVAEALPYHADRNGFVMVTFHGRSLIFDFGENEIVGFDENLAVVLRCDLQNV